MKLPWKTKGLVLTAPYRKDVDKVVRLIDEYLGPKGCDLLFLQIRYRYDFQSHPECRGLDPLHYEDIKKIVAVCKKHNIRLIPKMNLQGHQSGVPSICAPGAVPDSILHGHSDTVEPDIRDGLLRAYPEFDEMPDQKAVEYSRSLCLTNPLVKYILFDLMDELIDVFEADALHIGCDEVFHIGKCEECSKYSNRELFANWVTSLHDHLAKNNKQVFMWADRLLNHDETQYDIYESAINGTEGALYDIPKDIVLCDWHYTERTEYPSVDIFGNAGFKMLIGPGWLPHRAMNFIEYAKAHDQGHINGVLMTTWCNSGELADCILDNKPPVWERCGHVAEVIKLILE